MELGLDLESKVRSVLKKSELFSLLSELELEKFIKRLSCVQLGLGDLLEEKSAEQLSILLSGKIRLIERYPDGTESNFCILDKASDIWSNSWLAVNNSAIIMARSSDTTLILTLERNVLSELKAQNKKFAECLIEIEQQWDIFSYLRQLLIFRALSPPKLKSLVPYFKRISLKEADETFNNLSGIFIVISGKVKSLNSNENKIYTPGNSFVKGDFASFGVKDNFFTLVETCEFITLSSEKYFSLTGYAPELAQNLIECISSIDNNISPKVQFTATATNKIELSTPRDTSQNNDSQETELSFPTRVNKLFHQYPFIMQQSKMDCGVTCLAMIALFYGKKLDINDLRERSGVSIEGTSLLALAETAESIGFMARGIRGTYEGFLSAKLPIICFWQDNHFVVLYEINSKEARIGDPAEGLITISREQFTKCFSKSALELVPTVELKRAPGAKNPLTILLPLLKPYGKQIRDVLAAGLVYQTLMIITPFFSQTIVDRVIVHEDISMLNMLLLGMILVSCFQSALTFARGVLISTLSTKIDHALFVQFFKHLFSLPLKFFEQRSTGDILARFNENARITSFLSGSTIIVLLDGAMAIVYLAVLFYYSWEFGLASLLYIGLLLLATTIYTPLLRGYSNELFKKNVANDSCVIESIHGFEKIKSAAAENRIRWKWEILFVEKLSVSFKQQIATNGYSVFTNLVHLVGRITLMWLGAHLVISKTFTVGQYMAANMMSGMVVDPILRVISMWQQLQSVNISIERLGDVFRSTPEQTGQKTRVPDLQGFIELRNVTFRYNEQASKNTILNVSLRIQPNKMIAIVGRSGCGKTTLIRLIQGLYLPSSGSVLIDGVDTTQIELSDLRKKIGIVAQQEFFFAGTVRENIAFYLPDASLEQIVAVAKIAGIHEKIKTMGSGYETILAEGGHNLSGGEKQRLAIARALLHNPRILIFDEATSALDSESERHIQSCMDSIRKDRTMIVIAHRLSTIKSADLILVMDQGQIAEAGNHEELLQKKGLYYHLCSQQSI